MTRFRLAEAPIIDFSQALGCSVWILRTRLISKTSVSAGRGHQHQMVMQRFLPRCLGMRSSVTTAAHAAVILLRAEITPIMAAVMAVGKITGQQHAVMRSEASVMHTGITAVTTALSAGETRRSGELTATAGPGTQTGTASIITAAATATTRGIAATAVMNTRTGAQLLKRAVLQQTARLQPRRRRARCTAAAGRLRRARTRGTASATALTANSASVTAGLFTSSPFHRERSFSALCLSSTCGNTGWTTLFAAQQAVF